MSASLVLQTSNMSLHEKLILSSVCVILASLLWKWSKTMLIIVNLEMCTAFIFSLFYLSGVILSTVLLYFLVFFVSEALIILSSLLMSMNTLSGSSTMLLSW